MENAVNNSEMLEGGRCKYKLSRMIINNPHGKKTQNGRDATPFRHRHKASQI